jgi:hypothetical protein
MMQDSLDLIVPSMPCNQPLTGSLTGGPLQKIVSRLSCPFLPGGGRHRTGRSLDDAGHSQGSAVRRDPAGILMRLLTLSMVEMSYDQPQLPSRCQLVQKLQQRQAVDPS